MNDTERKHFATFRVPITILFSQADVFGRTAIVALYAACTWTLAYLRKRFEITDEEVKRAEEIAAETKDI